MNPNEPQKKKIFDPTINLGHILTFVGFVATGMVVYSTLERRVAVVETLAVMQAQRDTAQDLSLKEHRIDIKESLRDITSGLNRLNDKIEHTAKVVK